MNSRKSQANSLNQHTRGLSPRYLAKRISNIESLSAALNVDVGILVRIASNAEQHYRLFDRKEKPDGSIREIFDIQPPLKPILQRINKEIFKRCYYPPYLTGSLPTIREGTPEEELRRAESSYINNARRHSGQGTVIRIDATNFFPSIPERLIFAVWHELLQFAEPVSELLTKLTTHQGGLAQGSPTSSYLANLAFWHIEPHIVRDLQRRQITYSRYVDDIVVSSRQRLSTEEKSRVIRTTQKVFLSNGLKVKSAKTDVMDRNRRQTVHNTVVNAGRPTAGKDRRRRLQIQVNKYIADKQSAPTDSPELAKTCRQLEGKIREFAKLNPTAGRKLLAKLRENQ